MNKLVILSGSSNPKLAAGIRRILKLPVYTPVDRFANGEIGVKIPVPVKNCRVIILQSTSFPVNEHMVELLLIIDAAKRAGAKKITAIIPHFGYSRQDRTDTSGVPVSSELMGKLIKYAGATEILTIDMHSDNPLVTNVSADEVLIPKLMKINLKNAVVASPDKNGTKRARAYANLLNIKEVAVVDKERDKKIKNVSRAVGMTGNVKNKDVILVDDMIDTGGTILNAANLLKKQGAEKIIVVATHGIFSEPALTRLETSAIDRILITDSITQSEKVLNNPKFQICTIAPLLAKIINS